MKFTRSVMFTLITLIGLILMPVIASAQVVQAGIVVATDCKRTSTQTANQTVFLTVNQQGQLCTVEAPTTISSGLVPFDISTLTTTGGKALDISTSPGQIYALAAQPMVNSTSTWVNFFNVVAASVTPGTTSPLFSIQIPAITANAATTVYPIPWVSPIGVPYTTALSASCTTTQGGSTTSASTCRVFGLRK